MLMIWAFIGFLQSCGNTAKDQGEMQKPILQSEASATVNESGEGKEGADEGKGMRDMGTGSAAANTKEAAGLTFSEMQEAFKGETTASAKYAAYSKKAEAEGYHEIALLFNAASLSEKTHANNHKAVLEDASQQVPVITPAFTVKTTKENLQDALAGETYEITTMYPQFITNAAASKNQLAQISLNYAYKTEQKHKVFYEKALAALDANNVKSLPEVYYVCPTCGNTYDTTPPKRCGISMTNAEKFIRVTTITS